MNAPDAALIDASRNGDRAAFAVIVERYQRAVYAVSFARVRDRALSDDITQDTFVTAWRRLGDLRDAGRLPAWLCGIARNLARDARKRQRREHAGDSPALADPTTPFDALSDAESERLVAAALAGVPDVYREALVLFYYEQHSVEEVARVLGISPHTTNKRLSRGRHHLAARVEALVARRLTTRGPTRELVACVLAAIVVPAARADAAPTAKGSTMPKLAVTTVVLASIGGAGLIAARPTTAARTSPPAAPASPTRPAVSSPTTASATSRAANRAAAPPSLPQASSTVRVAPSCDAVGRHMAELQIDALDTGHHMPAQKLEQFVALRGRDLAKHCTTERWPDERRICVMAAEDSDGARVDCVEGIVATADELVALPRELRCDVVVHHVTELMSAPDGKLAAIARKIPGADRKQIADQLDAQELARCERIPWSIAVRRCLVASTTEQAAGSCTR
jgi:RNA polymerase sigma-70 factor (ECF subfamily)